MDKKIKFSLLAIWVLSSRGYDAYATYQYTPDLSQESNPLVSVLGLDWLALLTVVGLLSLYAIYTYYKATFQTYNFYPKEKGYSFSHFIGYTYLGRKSGWVSSFFKIPNDFQRFNYFVGHLLTPCLAFAGVVSTIMWILLNNSDLYREIHSAEMIYSIIVLGNIVILYSWLSVNYKKYNRITSV